MIPIPVSLLNEIKREAEKAYPNECCGFLLGSRDRAETCYPVENIQNEMHKRDPEGFPRRAHQAYFMNPRRLLELQKKMRQTGHSVIAVYHSHIDTEAYFSDLDREMALDAGGTPLFPESLYLVFSVVKGKVSEPRGYGWNPEKRNFEERPVVLSRPS